MFPGHGPAGLAAWGSISYERDPVPMSHSLATGAVGHSRPSRLRLAPLGPPPALRRRDARLALGRWRSG